MEYCLIRIYFSYDRSADKCRILMVSEKLKITNVYRVEG